MIRVFVLLATMALSSIAIAAPLQSQSNLYYQLGGAAAVSKPATPLNSTFDVEAGGDMAVGYACGNFDLKASVEGIIDDLESTMATIKAAPKALLKALPGHIFCRARPRDCQQWQHFAVRAEELFRVSVKSCEEMERAGAQGKNPLDGWIQISRKETWKSESKKHRTNPAKAKAAVDRNAGEEGVAWPGGRRGGRGQPPIRPVGDTASAGWCLLHNKPADCDGTEVGGTSAGSTSSGSGISISRSPMSTTGTAATPLSKRWKTPAEAREWVTDVLGDEGVRTFPGATPTGKAGVGLHPQVEKRQKDFRKSLQAAVNGNASKEDLDLLQNASIGATTQVVEALQRSPAKAELIERLASELALSSTIDDALLARRLLMTGRTEPHVAAAAPANETLDRKLSALETEIDQLLFEQRTRREVVSETALTVLKHDQSNGMPLRPDSSPSASSNAHSLTGGVSR